MKSAIEFHANGKLLLTGEYLVLAGAKALAYPVRFGQAMVVREIPGSVMSWVSISPSGEWFNATFDVTSLDIVSANLMDVAVRLRQVLEAAHRLNPAFLSGSAGWQVSVTADYPPEWGLGSSSTLYALVAAWAKVDVYDLFRLLSNGSGYDVACAGRNDLFFYLLDQGTPVKTPAIAGKALRENTWFAYLGRKQNSAQQVGMFLSDHAFSATDLVAASQLSKEICSAGSPDELIRLVNEHESLIGTILRIEPIARRFQSFPGTVKSLGAWGGDFAMFVSAIDPTEVFAHLHGLGFLHIFQYNDLEIKS